MAVNTPRVSSGADRVEEVDARLAHLRSTMTRLRRAADQVAIGFSIQAAEVALRKRVAAFLPSGDPAADLAELDELERQAASLLNKANRQRRTNSSRRVAGAAGIIIRSR
jgi:hypothetical protein